MSSRTEDLWNKLYMFKIRRIDGFTIENKNIHYSYRTKVSAELTVPFFHFNFHINRIMRLFSLLENPNDAFEHHSLCDSIIMIINIYCNNKKNHELLILNEN